ncbi:MAG: metallophosphoesterase [Luteolibacter sp.]|uniref:metallophosphoesterase family protein n=1 Tax=Luteolibacter sp. TaxID=1962973 RepID=UPI003263F556
MISEFLDRKYVLDETKSQRDYLIVLQRAILAKDPKALAAIKREGITLKQVGQVIAALDHALKSAEKDDKHPQGSAYIPSDPITCGLQAGMTEIAVEKNLVEKAAPATGAGGTRGGPVAKMAFGKKGATGKKKAKDTSATLKLVPRKKRRSAPPSAALGMAKPFVEGEDPLYALDGFKAKFGGLFSERRKFNDNPAKTAKSSKPLTLFLFGDWGTGLPLAKEVTNRIAEQLRAMDGSRQPHVIHLGDVYYVGEPGEYASRMLPQWPVTGDLLKSVGCWSLNGNHDMYSGGGGYFDTLLRDKVMLRWHGDADKQPSSFFLIEDDNWQVFGLDTSWNLPSLSDALFGGPTLKDYGGQNGILTKSQVTWMARERKRAPGKGCILLTHHQPCSSRTTEDQHADEAVKLLKAAGVYKGIDAWFWGHEHRGVVFKPKTERKTARLKDAPDFCVCLGHGGVPVTQKNFEADKTIKDVLWQEDRLDETAPMYEGVRVVPFGFGRIDASPGEFRFQVFDHAGGKPRFDCVVSRTNPLIVTVPSPHGVPGIKMAAAKRATKAAKKAPARKAAKKTAKPVAKKATKKIAKKNRR